MRVAITGVGGGVGQAVIRSLRISSLPLELVGLDANAWSAGLYQCDQAYTLPMVCEAEAYVAALARIVGNGRVDVLIPGTDTELLTLAQARDGLEAFGCCTIVSTPAVVRMARDKLETCNALARLGLPFVRTLRVDEFARTCTTASFPAMLKPKDGSGSAGTKVLFDPDDLTPEMLDGESVVQEYLVPVSWGLARVTREDVIRGVRLRQEDELSVQGLVAPDGSVVGVFVSINELRDGVVTKVNPQLDPDLQALAHRMFEALAQVGHVGPCNIEGRLTRHGPLFYEINPRFTGVTAARAEMGFNECEAALRLFAHREAPASVARRLTCQADLVCLRYMTEQTVPRSAIEKASGRSARTPVPAPRGG